MNASYANADDDGNVLKWLVSGFKASAASGKTVAQMFSDSSEGAIAGVMTEVNKKADSDEVENVKASLAAMWGDGAIAGANAVADPSKVRASLFATNADKTASAKIIVDAINDSTDSSIILDASKIDITADFINAVKAELDVDSIVTNKLTAGTGKFIGNVEATSFKVMNGNVESIVFTTMTSSLRSQYNNLDASGIEDGEPIGIVYSNGTPKYFFDFAPLTKSGGVEQRSWESLNYIFLDECVEDSANDINVNTHGIYDINDEILQLIKRVDAGYVSPPYTTYKYVSSYTSETSLNGKYFISEHASGIADSRYAMDGVICYDRNTKFIYTRRDQIYYWFNNRFNGSNGDSDFLDGAVEYAGYDYFEDN